MGLNFASDRTVSYPGRPNPESGNGERSLRVDVNEWPTTRRGICQRGIPVRNGHVYDGYVWIKSMLSTAAFAWRSSQRLKAESPTRRPRWREFTTTGPSTASPYAAMSTIPWRDWRSSSRDGAASG